MHCGPFWLTGGITFVSFWLVCHNNGEEPNLFQLFFYSPLVTQLKEQSFAEISSAFVGHVVVGVRPGGPEAL